ncbi:Uncharacterized lipoprotein ygdR precursor [Leminorella richardii]|uniref:Uncharacterized lipoprotein ygdR n=1 Tax=Leminorella richardii TaxID=158841 RepID=A0A2X4UBP2_9GAMM|nr:YgdI/YgdR family lipoprotein [Leminorella richardii]SQI36291.1 Uncharacterized lipoprotein ygdR precursor [Leminorella richardii]
MKRKVLSCVALLLALGVAGCSSHYEVTMQDGTKVIAVGKPSLDESTGIVTFDTRFDGEKQVPQSEIKEYVKQPY